MPQTAVKLGSTAWPNITVNSEKENCCSVLLYLVISSYKSFSKNNFILKYLWICVRNLPEKFFKEDKRERLNVEQSHR